MKYTRNCYRYSREIEIIEFIIFVKLELFNNEPAIPEKSDRTSEEIIINVFLWIVWKLQ